jgi:hypothetical protein
MPRHTTSGARPAPRRAWLRPALLLALSLACLLGARAHAGTALRMEVADLARHADLALQGRVLEARAVLAPEGRVDTEYRVAVERTFWGEDRPERVLRIPGGEIPGGPAMLLAGVRRLAPGEEVVLFLGDEAPGGMRMPIGLAQGQLRLVADRAGRRFLVRDQHGLDLLDPRTGVVRRADGFAAYEYAPFLAELEAALALRRAAERAESTRGR